MSSPGIGPTGPEQPETVKPESSEVDELEGIVPSIEEEIGSAASTMSAKIGPTSPEQP